MDTNDNQADRARLILELFGRIQHEWVTGGNLKYAVLPAVDIRPLSFHEVKAITFKVGVTPEGPLVELNAVELTALFKIVRDYYQAASSGELKPDDKGRASQDFTIDFNPPDEFMKAILSQVQFLNVVPADAEPTNVDEPHDSFGMTQSRMNYLLELVGHRFNGHTFKIYPPTEYLSGTFNASTKNVFDTLKNTVWYLKWKDGREDALSFMELLTLVHQMFTAMGAQRDAMAAAEKAAKENPKAVKPDGTIPVTVKTRFDPRELVTDEHVLLVLSKLDIEKEPRPNTMVN